MSAQADLTALGPIPRDAEGPVFTEAWEAQAFAMALLLHQRGHMSWPEWSTRLAAEIADAERRGAYDAATDYYACWLSALEKLVAEKGLVPIAEIAIRKQEWDEAARATPHGRPIELTASRTYRERQ